MSSNFRKDQLENKIAEYGIFLDENVQWTNEKLIKILGDYYMQESGLEFTWAQKYFQSIETVMLCHHLKDDIKNFPVSPFQLDEFVAERKANGMRFLMGIDPAEGITVLSRKASVKTYLNGVFTNKILFIKDGVIRTPEMYKNVFKDRIIIEGEITINHSDGNNFEGVEYSSVEDYIQAVLGSNPEKAKEYQKAGHELIFTVFDVLYFEKNASPYQPIYRFNYEDKELTKEDIAWVEETFNNYLVTCNFKLGAKKPPKLLYQYLASLRNLPAGDVRKYPFYKRRKLRREIVKMLNSAGIPIREIDGEDIYKASYLDELLREGEEGIILKNIYAPYISALKSSRSHRAEMKVKQSVANFMKDKDTVKDFDVFITGANPPKSNRIKDMIGSLKCSIYIVDEFGETKIHEIANVSGISHEWKRKLAKVDPVTGEISLNEEYLDKVIPIDGLALSATNMKFQHAVLKDRGNIEFKPKNPTDCTWDKEELEKLVITRGEK